VIGDSLGFISRYIASDGEDAFDDLMRTKVRYTSPPAACEFLNSIPAVHP